MILRSTCIKSALRSRQRGFLLNPSRFAVSGGGGDPYYSSVVLLAHFNASPPVDNSPTPMTLANVGTVTYNTTTKKYGAAAAQFDTSSSDYVSVAANSRLVSTGAFTFELWIYPTNLEGGQINPVYQSSGGINIYISSDRRARCSIAGTNLILSDLSVPDSAWTHIAFCRDGSNLCTGYVAGVKSSQTMTQSGNFGVNDTMRLGNGVFAAGPAKVIDDLRYTRGVNRYSVTFTPPTAEFPDS